MEIFVAIYVIQATTHKTSFHDDHSVTRVLHTVTCLGLVFPTEHFSNQFKLGAVITRLCQILKPSTPAREKVRECEIMSTKVLKTILPRENKGSVWYFISRREKKRARKYELIN